MKGDCFLLKKPLAMLIDDPASKSSLFARSIKNLDIDSVNVFMASIVVVAQSLAQSGSQLQVTFFHLNLEHRNR